VKGEFNLMNEKKYILTTFILIGALLTVVAFINVIIDPKGFYKFPFIESSNEKYLNSISRNFTKDMIAQGISIDSLDQRGIKYHKILKNRNAEFDCIVFGASQVHQFTSIGPHKALIQECKSLLNFSFPGSSIEDYLAASHILINENYRDLKVFFSISPELFSSKESKYLFWLQNFEYVKAMNSLLKNRLEIENPYFKLITNLINPDYFLRSIERGFISKYQEPYNVVDINFEAGHSNTLLLRDGSLVYSSSYISNKAVTPILPIPELKLNRAIETKNNTTTLNIGSIEMSSGGALYSKTRFNTFKELMNLLNQRGYDINFIFTPIHEAIYFESINSISAQSLRQVEIEVLKYATQLKFDVFGSYNPRVVGCQRSEFYDSTHLKYSCITKIKFM
jgi:hypothetical protein